MWHIQPCSALKGEGLVTGIKWLSEQLTFRGKNNFPNNPYLIDDNENQNNDINNSENKEISITVNDPKDSIASNNNLNNINIGGINKVDEIKEVANDIENNINNNIDENNINNEK